MSFKALTAEKKKADEEFVHQQFAERYQETIRERNDNSGGGGGSGGSGNNTVLVSNPNEVFEDPDQKVILINIAHRHQNPKSKIPSFRICGAFPDVDRLKRHVSSTGGVNAYGGANLLKAEAHKKFIICTSYEKQQNADYMMTKINDITERYIKTLKFHNEEFNQNKSNRKQGKTGLSTTEKIKKHTSRKELIDSKFDQESKSGTENGEVGRNAEVRNQSVAVISILDDLTPAVLNAIEDPEPVVIVWGCFENDKQAKDYIYNTASKYVKDLMLDIVNMYEWVYPTEIAKRVEEIDEEFRDPTLNKVMKSRKQQKEAVLSYEEWVKTQDMQPSVLEINATKANEDSTEVKTEVKKSDDVTMQVSLRGSGGVGSTANRSSDCCDDDKQLTQTTTENNIFNAPDWQPVQATVDKLFKDVTFSAPTSLNTTSISNVKHSTTSTTSTPTPIPSTSTPSTSIPASTPTPSTSIPASTPIPSTPTTSASSVDVPKEKNKGKGKGKGKKKANK